MFTKGMLYFRLENGVPRDLFYALENADGVSFRCRQLAQLTDSPVSVRSNIINALESGTVRPVNNGKAIEFIPATNEAIGDMMLRPWVGDHSAALWLSKVQLETDLLPSELSRLQRVAEAYIAYVQ